MNKTMRLSESNPMALLCESMCVCVCVCVCIFTYMFWLCIEVYVEAFMLSMYMKNQQEMHTNVEHKYVNERKILAKVERDRERRREGGGMGVSWLTGGEICKPVGLKIC